MTIRECNGCTVCCDGWLMGEANGHYFQPGRPCFYKCETGCSIHETRPEDPCGSFVCDWLMNQDLPEWMKPSMSKVMVTRSTWEGGEYLTIWETGQKIDSVVLNWFFIYHLSIGIPMRIQISGGFFNYGPPEFLNKFGVKEANINFVGGDR